ncbi:MAG: helix-turn-helix domain-containing protein [Clostridiales bacterium]|nr:helix-turn-helix domain-containing protein [Clostridiales bacterium]
MRKGRVKLRSLGEKIKLLRKEKLGLTQQEFADKLNISLDTVKNWEQGWNYPEIDMIVILADLFDCDFDFLLGSQEQPNKEYAYITELTGLSYSAADTLSEIAKAKNPIVNIVSDLLENTDLLYSIYGCATADYGSIASPVEIPDPLSNAATLSRMIRPRQIRQSDSMELYNTLCEFVDALRKKNGLPTSKEI